MAEPQSYLNPFNAAAGVIGFGRKALDAGLDTAQAGMDAAQDAIAQAPGTFQNFLQGAAIDGLQRQMLATDDPQRRYQILKDATAGNPQAQEFFEAIDSAPDGARERIQNGLANTFAHNDEFARMLADPSGKGIGIDAQELKDILEDPEVIPRLGQTRAEFMGDIMQASGEAAQQGVNFNPAGFPQLAKDFKEMDRLLEEEAGMDELLAQGQQIQGTLSSMGLGAVNLNLPATMDPMVLFTMLLNDPNQFGTEMVKMMGLDPELAPGLTNMMQGLSQFMANGPIGQLAAVIAHYYPGMEQQVMGMVNELHAASRPQDLHTVEHVERAIEAVNEQSQAISARIDTIDNNQKQFLKENGIEVTSAQRAEVLERLEAQGVDIASLQGTTDTLSLLRNEDFRQAYRQLDSVEYDENRAVSRFGGMEDERLSHQNSLSKLGPQLEKLENRKAELQARNPDQDHDNNVNGGSGNDDLDGGHRDDLLTDDPSNHARLSVPGLEGGLESNIRVASAYGDGNDPVARTDDFPGQQGDFSTSGIEVGSSQSVLSGTYGVAALGKDVAAPEDTNPAADVTRDMQRQVTAGMNLTA